VAVKQIQLCYFQTFKGLEELHCRTQALAHAHAYVHHRGVRACVFAEVTSKTEYLVLGVEA